MVYFYTFFDNVGYFSLVKQNWKKQIWNHDGLDDVSFREFTRKKTKHDVNFQKHLSCSREKSKLTRNVKFVPFKY